MQYDGETTNISNNMSINRSEHPGLFYTKQGRKRPLDTPKKMIERGERERRRERERKVEGAI